MMRRNYVWNLVDDGGEECVEFGGYYIPVERAVNETGFFATHLRGKTWATRQVVADFVDMSVDLARGLR